MRIGIIGAGAMAEALGAGWVKAAHEVMIGGRTPEKTAELAKRIGASSGTLKEAAEFGQVTLLAVPAFAIEEVLRRTEPRGPLIDCTNAFDPATFETGEIGLLEDALAARVAALAPHAQVVKAFNVCAAEVWQAGAHSFEGRPLTVPLCGDDEAALTAVEGLVEDLGLQALRGGGLARAKYLEAMAAFVVGLWFGGNDARTALPPLTAAFAVPD